MICFLVAVAGGCGSSATQASFLASFLFIHKKELGRIKITVCKNNTGYRYLLQKKKNIS